jgi:hypothetical protein
LGVLGIFEIGAGKLFAQAGLEPQSSWSLPPEWLGLQVWAAGTKQIGFLMGIRTLGSQALVAHACNPCYSVGRDQENCGWKPAQANSLGEPISKKPNTKKGWWSGRTKTTPRVEKERFIGGHSARLTLRFRVQQLSWNG